MPEDNNTDIGFFLPEFSKGGKVSENSLFGLVLEGLDVVISAMIAVIILFVFIFKIPTIEGSSMNDTLFDGERIVISDVGYEPQYGDIVDRKSVV